MSTHKHIQTHTGKSIFSLCMVNTFPFVFICEDVLILGALSAEFLSFMFMCCRTLVFICFCPLSDIAVLAYSFVWHRQVLSQPESRITCFRYRFQIQQLHSPVMSSSHFNSSRSIKLPNSQRRCP